MVEQPDYAPNVQEAFRRYSAAGGITALYDGLLPLLVRQVLFGMVKFLVFDYCADAIYALLQPSARSDAFASAAVSLASGAVAGTAAAIFSQPADVILSQVAQSASCETVERGVLPGTANKLALLAETGQRLLRTYGPSGLYLGLGEFVRHFRLISSLGGRGHARTDGRFFLSLRASPSGLCVGALCDWSLATVCETRYACAQHPSSLPLMLVLVSHQASSKLTSCVSLPRFSPPLTSLPPFLHCHYHQPLLIPPLKDHEWCGRVRSLLANSSCTTCSKTPCT